MAPFPNTRVIPEGWSAHHRPVVAQTWTGTCTIHHPSDFEPGDIDPETGEYPEPGAGSAHYDGACRVQVQPIFSGEREAGGQEVTVAGYLVVVEQDTSADTLVGDIVTITAVDDNGDAALVARKLRVSGVAYGTLTWERDLTCHDQLG